MAAFGGLAEAVVEVGEGGLGMLEAAGDEVLAYEDGSVCAVKDTIARAELHALAGHGGVDANAGSAMAGGAERWRGRWRV